MFIGCFSLAWQNASEYDVGEPIKAQQSNFHPSFPALSLALIGSDAVVGKSGNRAWK